MRRYRCLPVPIVLLWVLFAAAMSALAQEAAGPHPWTDKPVLDSADRFQFAIIADVTGGRRAGVFEDALRKLNMLQPAFVMCVGDLIEGYSEDAADVKAQRDVLRKELDALDMRFYMLPGNHDISNPTMAEQWTQQNGASYYSFVYRNVLFLCLNTEDPPDTHISQEQIAYALKALADHPDVRWTFVFMHKPLWLYYEDADQHGWRPISDALKGRPHTVFGGHFHSYVEATRDDAEHYALSTTGGSSELAGPQLGQFDHIVWVTMKEGGPSVANLQLSGILRPDVVTEEMDVVNTALSHADYLQTAGVASDAQMFTSGELELALTDDQPVPLSITGRFGAHGQLAADPAEFAVKLAPGESGEVTVAVKAKEPTDLIELRPMTLHLDATWQPEGREPVTVPASRQIDVHGTHEGPDMVTNGGFGETGGPWFSWVQRPEFGTVAFGDGEARAVLTDPEFAWSAGIGQYVKDMRPGGRYRLSFKAANTGGPGRIHCQVGIDGQEAPLYLTVDGERTQSAQVAVGEEMAQHAVEFVMPSDVDLATAKLLFLLGDLRNARVDDVSLREMTGAPVAVE